MKQTDGRPVRQRASHAASWHAYSGVVMRCSSQMQTCVVQSVCVVALKRSQNIVLVVRRYHDVLCVYSVPYIIIFSTVNRNYYYYYQCCYYYFFLILLLSFARAKSSATHYIHTLPITSIDVGPIRCRRVREYNRNQSAQRQNKDICLTAAKNIISYQICTRVSSDPAIAAIPAGMTNNNTHVSICSFCTAAVIVCRE